MPSAAISRLPRVPVLQRQLHAIRGNQRQSKAIKGNQWRVPVLLLCDLALELAIKGNQRRVPVLLLCDLALELALRALQRVDGVARCVELLDLQVRLAQEHREGGGMAQVGEV